MKKGDTVKYTGNQTLYQTGYSPTFYVVQSVSLFSVRIARHIESPDSLVVPRSHVIKCD